MSERVGEDERDLDEDPADVWIANARRRRRLLGSALGLVALGLVANGERIFHHARPWLVDPPERIAMDEIVEDRRFVAYLKQPDAMPAEGTGARHRGEEGKMGRPTSKSKSGLYAMKGPRDGERYAATANAKPVASADDSRSTFSIDVDTASYTNVRRILADGETPPIDAVRTEELVNYFHYDDPAPSDDVPFSVTSEVTSCPWAPEHRLMRIGLRGASDPTDAVRNLVFLVDVSGSMADPDKLPLVREALAGLVVHLDERDRVAIVTYAGDSGVVLTPTPGDETPTILAAVQRLGAGGGTNGAAGIREAYALAREHFVEGGVNRVVLATDGDFNVGPSSVPELLALIEKERESGVFLSVLGFGTGSLRDDVMEQIADHGNGNYSYIDSIAEGRRVLVDEADATLVTIAKDVKIQVEFDPAMVARHRLVGYENRTLAHHEFADDTVDAGEIGAGHSVTALYEIEPVESGRTGALAEVDLRYKAPDGDTSELVETTVYDDGGALEDASSDLRFAAAVAGFAQKLRRVPAAERLSFVDTFALARGALGSDPRCERHGFLALVQRAGRLAGEPMHEIDVVCEATAAPYFGRIPRVQPLEKWRIREVVIDTLRLLPPLLALPLFVLAFVRRGTRRRRGR